MNRRNFLRGMVAFVAAPAIVRATSLMPVSAFIDDGTFMPTYGGLYYPGSIARELAVVTRKAFIPRLFVQIYEASPIIGALEAQV